LLLCRPSMTNPSFQPPLSSKPAQPKLERKDCPACGFMHATEKLQCDQCGVIFSKWKDPQQKAAERKLQQIESESRQGMPVALKWTLLFLIFVPSLIYFVPDIQTRLMGGKVQYHMPLKSTFLTKGAIDMSISTVDSIGQLIAPLDSVELLFQKQVDVMETDSGGNTTYKESYQDVSLQTDSIPGQHTMDPSRVSSWTERRVISRLGNTISTLIQAAELASGAAKTSQHLQQRRIEIEQERAQGDMMRGMSSSHGQSSPPPDPLEPITKGEIQIADLSLFFRFPKVRVRPGYQWNQPVSWKLHSPHVGLEVRGDQTFILKDFVREGSAYLTVIEWNWDLSPIVYSPSQQLNTFLANHQSRGSLQGTAWLDYKTGILENVEGRFDFTLNPQSEDGSTLLKSFKLSPNALNNQKPHLRFQGKFGSTRT